MFDFFNFYLLSAHTAILLNTAIKIQQKFQNKKQNIIIKSKKQTFFQVLRYNYLQKVFYIVPINNSQKLEIIKQTSISKLILQKMNSQIVLSIQKLTIQQKQYNFEQKIIQILILTDSCFQKIITQRKIKNNCANLFGQKIFLPSNTKQILFDVTVQENNNIKQRICCFSYGIEKLSALNKKKILQNLYLSQQIKEPISWNLHISTKLNLEIQTNTLLNTEQLISDLYSPMNEISNIINQVNNSNNLNHYKKGTMNSFKNDNNRIFSPNHQQSKFKNQYFKSINLNNLQDQNWEIKSQLSPSKKDKQLKQNFQSYNFRKQQKFIWLQPVVSPKIDIQKNPQEKNDLLQYKTTFQTESVNEGSVCYYEDQNKKNDDLQIVQIATNINCPYVIKVSQNALFPLQVSQKQVVPVKNLQKSNKNLTKNDYAAYQINQQQKNSADKPKKSVRIPHNFNEVTHKKLNNSYKYFKGNEIKLMLIIGGFLGILCAWFINNV